MNRYRIIDLPDGNKLQIKFEQDGIVYDLLDSNNELLEERGFDLYCEDVPVKLIEGLI